MDERTLFIAVAVVLLLVVISASAAVVFMLRDAEEAMREADRACRKRGN